MPVYSEAGTVHSLYAEQIHFDYQGMYSSGVSVLLMSFTAPIHHQENPIERTGVPYPVPLFKLASLKVLPSACDINISGLP